MASRSSRSTTGFDRFQKTSALLPLALLSAAVTASFTGLGPASTAVAGEEGPTTLPDGTSVPTEALEVPASVSSPGVVVGGLGGRRATEVAGNTSTSGIPAAALAAYQRAETVINSADKSCNIQWQLIAAIGRVESDHGRANGNTLDDEGLATPGIFGIALNGKNNTQAIRDTDAGQYDSDAKWDRAVGPMQFIPSTWSVVGVDGDNDGQRNPQDIDDAALASAVYLCSGKDDLSTDAGRRAAIFRYNHSDEYVDLVLAYMDAYMEGEFTSVPNTTTSSFDISSGGSGLSVFSPASDPRGGKKGGKKGGKNNGGSGGTGGSDGGTTTPGGGGGTVTNPPTDGDGDGNGGGLPNLPTPNLPPVEEPKPGGNGGGDTGGGGTVEDTLTKAEATAQCLQQVGASSVASLTALQLPQYTACMTNLGF